MVRLNTRCSAAKITHKTQSKNNQTKLQKQQKLKKGNIGWKNDYYYILYFCYIVYTGGGKTPSQQAGACNLLGKDSGCGEHEECKLKPTKTSLTTECACIVGYKLDDKLQKCVKGINVCSTSSLYQHILDQAVFWW